MSFVTSNLKWMRCRHFIAPILSLTFLAALSGEVTADLVKGRAAYRSGDYETALKEFKESAEQGNGHAQYDLGLLYRRGLGVAVDYKEAAKWFAKAANKDIHRAQSALGGLYSLGRGIDHDHYRAYFWYLTAAHGRAEKAGKYTGKAILKHLEKHVSPADRKRAEAEVDAWRKKFAHKH